MLTELLWFASAKQQHDIQRSAGLAGICGILLTLFIVWQWDNIFAPIIRFFGLDDLANRMGLVQDTPIHTICNVLVVIVALLIIIAVLCALPSFIVLALAAATENKFLVVPLSYIIFFLLSPIIFCYYMYLKLNDRFRLNNGPETLKQHYLRDSNLRNDYKGVEQLPEQLKLHHLFANQPEREQEGFTSSAISYNEAVTYLNHAVASIEADRNWLVGYQEDTDQFYVLFPNPLPVYASPCFKDKQVMNYADNSPFGYKELRDKYTYYLFSQKKDLSYLCTESDKIPPSFYVPAYKFSYKWVNSKIVFEIEDRKIPESLNIERLTTIKKLDGSSIRELFEQIAKQPTVFKAIKNAHIRSYLIPVAYPEEIEYLTDTECTLSYIKELNKVPYTREYASIYRADVKEAAVDYAERGYKWAINYINNTNNLE